MGEVFVQLPDIHHRGIEDHQYTVGQCPYIEDLAIVIQQDFALL
jgi:hypothetical protein